MPEGARQLVLDLPVEASVAEEDFLVGPSNAAAHALVTRWPDWPSPAAVLVGGSGSGKTHLATIWARRAGGRLFPAASLSAAAPAELLAAGPLALEDLDRPGWPEAAMFHLLNAARERGTPLLLTSALPPDALGLRTPDLLSRLRLAPHLRLEPPDDALLRAVLVKLFHDRQLLVDASVVEYLVQRMERSLGRARLLVAELDREALRRGRRVTRPIAAEILSDEGPEDDGEA